MNCTVYRSTRKADTYVFVERADDFSRLPGELAVLLGTLEPVMDLELHEGRPLARADAAEVMHRLKTQGYYLQLPPAPDQPSSRTAP